MFESHILYKGYWFSVLFVKIIIQKLYMSSGESKNIAKKI